jgi:hypothetical protein
MQTAPLPFTLMAIRRSHESTSGFGPSRSVVQSPAPIEISFHHLYSHKDLSRENCYCVMVGPRWLASKEMWWLEEMERWMLNLTEVVGANGHSNIPPRWCVSVLWGLRSASPDACSSNTSPLLTALIKRTTIFISSIRAAPLRFKSLYCARILSRKVSRKAR